MPKQHELMQFFKYEHLPEKLQAASKPFCGLAEILLNMDSLELETAGTQHIEAVRQNLLSLPLSQQNVESDHADYKLVKARSLTGGYFGGARIDAILRLVLEAKDCAVRAVLYKEPEEA